MSIFSRILEDYELGTKMFSVQPHNKQTGKKI